MQGERTKRKKRISKTNRSVHRMNLSQERASYFFFTGLLIIAIFSCVASGAPKQGFYGIIFLSIGILVAIFPPSFVIPRQLYKPQGLKDLANKVWNDYCTIKADLKVIFESDEREME